MGFSFDSGCPGAKVVVIYIQSNFLGIIQNQKHLWSKIRQKRCNHSVASLAFSPSFFLSLKVSRVIGVAAQHHGEVS